MNPRDNILAHALNLQSIYPSGANNLEMFFQIINILLHVLPKHIAPLILMSKLGKDTATLLRRDIAHSIQARLVKITGSMEHLESGPKY